MGKLVRDKIPDIIATDGRSVRYKVIRGDDLKKELVKKLAEEYKELINSLEAGDVGDILEECADLGEVVKALADDFGDDSSAFNRAVASKALRCGTFSKGVYLEEWSS